MKKFISILLLTILLFNWTGYRLLVSFMEEKANNDLESALDNNNYDEGQLISIKIPITYLPYYNNSLSYERVDGHIEIEGYEYKYVKRRIYNDSLELLCIANPAVTKLKKVNNEFFQFVNDLQHNGQEKNNGPHRNISGAFSADYCAINHVSALTNSWSFVSAPLFHHISRIACRHRLVLEEPPEFM